MHSTYYNFWKMCFDNKFIVDLNMYKQAVVKNIITTAEFKIITEQDYAAS